MAVVLRPKPVYPDPDTTQREIDAQAARRCIDRAAFRIGRSIDAPVVIPPMAPQPLPPAARITAEQRWAGHAKAVNLTGCFPLRGVETTDGDELIIAFGTRTARHCPAVPIAVVMTADGTRVAWHTLFSE